MSALRPQRSFRRRNEKRAPKRSNNRLVSVAGVEPARPFKWAQAPQACVSAFPPHRQVNSESYYIETSTEVNRVILQLSRSLLRIDGPLGINDHQHQQGHREHQCENDGDAVQILLHERRGLLRAVQSGGNGVADARALARMQHDEHNQANARNQQQDDE